MSSLNFAFGQDFCHGRCRPIKGMRVEVPIVDKGNESIRQLGQASKVRNAESLALQNTKPLLDLVHPGTMDWRKMADKARMGLQPRLHLLSLVHLQVVHH